MIAAWAFAKVNLSLSVRPVRADGMHPLLGLYTSISWTDRLWLGRADEDLLEAEGGGRLPDGDENLAWRAALAVRDSAGAAAALHLRLTKRIPMAAGLGGGSADAAAVLGAAGVLLGVSASRLSALAPELGSDVPFCFTGGFAEVAGIGERVAARDPLGGFAIAVVVPPVELSAAAVYTAWDRLGGPAGDPLADRHLPPVLRETGPLGNDLTPAAIDLAPAVAEWRSELEMAWGRPVAMSGSGPTLFAFFVDEDEAGDALDEVPPGARATRAAVPAPFGWVVEADGAEPVDSRGKCLGDDDDDRLRLLDG